MNKTITEYAIHKRYERNIYIDPNGMDRYELEDRAGEIRDANVDDYTAQMLLAESNSAEPHNPNEHYFYFRTI